jgi:hypothetical protein
MLFSKIVAVYSNNRMKHINTMFIQNTDVLVLTQVVFLYGKYNYSCALTGSYANEEDTL